MSHVKIITAGAQTFDEPPVQLVKLAQHGLRGRDLADFSKRAAPQLVEKVASAQFGPGEVPIHLIAVGAHEYYGFNRNGDGFTEDTCKEHHGTFKKHAHFYRHHRNKDPKKSYGRIADATYNDKMHRIELLVALNGTKEAADRNGGLVADEEMEKLDSDKSIPVSMACLVDHDVCSGCGNKAKSRAEYCDDTMCKYGGCKDNLAKTFDDGHTLGVFNPKPRWFDISHVFRPADRIAYVLGITKQAADYFDTVKAAAATIGSACGGAALAERMGVTAPLSAIYDIGQLAPRLADQLKIAQTLVAAEDVGAGGETVLQAYAPEVWAAHADVPDIGNNTTKLASVLTALAAAKCVMPLTTFAALVTGAGTEKAAAAVRAAVDYLPGVFTRLAADPQLETLLQTNPFLATGAVYADTRQWAMKQAAAWSIDRDRVVERLQLAALRQAGTMRNKSRQIVKLAEDSAAAKLAQQYALYQLGMLHMHKNAEDLPFLCKMVASANGNGR